MSAGKVFGVLAASVLLSGRWSFSRLEEDVYEDPLTLQPRFWLVALLVSVLLLGLRHPSLRSRLRLEWPDRWTILLFGYMTLSYGWAPDHEMTGLKLVEMILEGIAIGALACGRSIYDRREVDIGFWTMLLLIGAGLAAVTIAASGSGRAITPGGGPIAFGRNMGLMALAAWRLGEHNLRARKGVAGIAIVVAALLILWTGSRGALLSFSVACAVLIVLARMAVAYKVAAVASIACLVGAVLTFTETGRNARNVFQQRIVETTFQNGHLSGRDDLWLTAGELWVEKPVFGWGINGFRANSWNYPHNLFLEVISEGGFVGAVLLLSVLGSYALIWLRWKRAIPPSCLAACALTFTSAQTSGDLYDTRCFFMLLVMAAPIRAQQVAGVAARIRGRLARQPIHQAPPPRRRVAA